MSFIGRNYKGFITVSIIMILYFAVDYSNYKDLKNNSRYTVGRVYEITYGKYTKRYAEFEYYYEGKRYTDSEPLSSAITKRDVLNRFFRVEVSSKKPSLEHIDFKQEIIDTNVIKLANFKIHKTKKP